MKSLVNYINENYINEDLVTKEIKSYKNNMTFYHVSVKKITQDTLTDYPMFCFYDYKQANFYAYFGRDPPEDPRPLLKNLKQLINRIIIILILNILNKD